METICIRDPLDRNIVRFNVPVPAHITPQQRQRIESTAYGFIGLCDQLKAEMPEAEYSESMSRLVPAMDRTLQAMIEG